MFLDLGGIGGGKLKRLSPGSVTGWPLTTPAQSPPFYPVATPGDAISITGGTYRKNGTGGFVATADTFTAGDRFELKGTSAGTYDTLLTPAVTLTVGGVDYVFDITTMPDATIMFMDGVEVTLDGEGATMSGGA